MFITFDCKWGNFNEQDAYPTESDIIIAPGDEVVTTTTTNGTIWFKLEESEGDPDDPLRKFTIAVIYDAIDTCRVKFNRNEHAQDVADYCRRKQLIASDFTPFTRVFPLGCGGIRGECIGQQYRGVSFWQHTFSSGFYVAHTIDYKPLK